MAFARRKWPSVGEAALLVIDMQEYFRNYAAQILPAASRTIAAARAAGIPVVYTRHSHKDSSDHGMLGEWWPSLVLDGTPEAELMPEIEATEADKVVHKHTYSGFHKTDLEAYLLKCGVREVIVIGVMTNLCCETTARDAFVRGFRVFFVTDATATCSDDLHRATIKNLGYGFAYMVDSEGLQRSLSSQAERRSETKADSP